MARHEHVRHAPVRPKSLAPKHVHAHNARAILFHQTARRPFARGVITDIEDPKQLEDYLRSTGRIGACEKISSRVLAGGVSNRTVWLRREDGACWVLKQALAKLRVKVDWYSDPARSSRE